MITTRILSPDEIKKKLHEKQNVAPCNRTTPDQEIVQAKKEASKTVEKVTKQAARAVTKIESKLQEVAEHAKSLSLEIKKRDRMTPMDLRKALNELFESYDFSPAEEMVQMLMNRSHPHYVEDVRTRVAILSDLQSYVMPKLKSTEIKGEVEHKHVVTIVRYGDDGVITKEAAPVMVNRENVIDVQEVVNG